MKPVTRNLIVAGMLFTGTINTLLNKFQDLQCVADCDTNHPKRFEQPLLQTLNMFFGEIMCLFVFLMMDWMKTSKGYEAIPESDPGDGDINPSTNLIEQEGIGLVEESEAISRGVRPDLTGTSQLLFMLPTLCDLTATTLMNIGLMFITASVYQMLRGSVVLFTGVFSSLFLGVRHPLYRWVALVVVFTGVGIVGLAPLLSPSAPTAVSSPHEFIGILLVVLAQAITATQFVLEEKIMHVFKVDAVKAVGLEGLFGLLMTVTAVPILHFTVGVTQPAGPGNVFDMYESFRELLIPNIMYATIGIMFSISLFNWCGLAVTQAISATSRSTIDTCRTFFIWMTSLYLGWETFSWIQVIGFLVLIYGTFLFNDVVKPPLFLRDPAEILLVEDILVNPAP